MICLWSFATPPPPVKDRYIKKYKKKIIAYWKLRAKLRDSCCYLPMTHTNTLLQFQIWTRILIWFRLIWRPQSSIPMRKKTKYYQSCLWLELQATQFKHFMLFFWISDFIVSICWESKFDTCLNLADDLGPCLHSPTHII